MNRSPARTAPATVSHAKLRRIALDAQGLLRQAPFGRGLKATQRAIERIGYVQIDTISVVARAHHHVLHSRVPNYAPAHLDKLQQQGAVFEYWYHAAAYLPIRDYRFALPRMEGMRNHTERWIRSRDTKLLREVLARVTAEGPLLARDFESPPNGTTGWWNWKPTKQALDQLFMQGDLMIAGREGFQKSYDLRDRLLPEDVDTRMPDDREMAEYLLDTMLRAHGFITAKSVTHLRQGKSIRSALKSVLEERLADEALVSIKQPCGAVAYADPEQLDSRAAPATARALLLSPFDNLVIHRDRILSLFDFDYQIECYLKEKDRRFGYFCLPITYRDNLVGRADCKAHRQEGRFEIRHLHLEPSQNTDEEFLSSLADAFHRFATFNRCEQISLTQISPSSRADAFQRTLTR